MATDADLQVAAGPVLAGFLVCACCLFVNVWFLLFLRNKLRTPVIFHIASALEAHFCFSLIVIPGRIHELLYPTGDGEPFSSLHPSYRWAIEFADILHAVVTLGTLMMFSIDRVLYIQNPSAYSNRMSRLMVSSMLATPWFLAFLFAIINASLPDVKIGMYLSIYGLVSFAVIGFILAIVGLTFWCCFKCKNTRATKYEDMGHGVVREVRNAVIAVAVLNIFVFLSMLVTWVLGTSTMNPLWTVIGVVECYVWGFTVKELREEAASFYFGVTCEEEDKEQAKPEDEEVKTEEPTAEEPEEIKTESV